MQLLRVPHGEPSLSLTGGACALDLDFDAQAVRSAHTLFHARTGTSLTRAALPPCKWLLDTGSAGHMSAGRCGPRGGA